MTIPFEKIVGRKPRNANEHDIVITKATFESVSKMENHWFIGSSFENQGNHRQASHKAHVSPQTPSNARLNSHESPPPNDKVTVGTGKRMRVNRINCDTGVGVRPPPISGLASKNYYFSIKKIPFENHDMSFEE
ncbi:hypothetical protein H112_03268 [Trichophyton rubrum D6]|uniref:Uncharacterized protein n=3 Tax=Trichophyton TaxID=5550 RepID=A0A080WMQ9_TRIRC|nr:uncharacterized protein TERG_12349 [Trichophyton rubrum CBS 118892]EZF24192.1 hypothetical protein H100_03272 [Trichophyton rubrum MR850]EZF43233.1 hypothetical protein H102_03266 [Trichophyton rubrum CBS 100081]EZF53890.1 hypothetical protein H103_03280 [Trichophyton rubrum CBS 288.86]EZF64493.1 hypothetical protein H104_03263 [Trichophyton rubrum CBS 289.86]EZF75121.1 hypothetical protein H105_03283 [Trichophyton soudanense CBS 452.61]EZF85782.1 hypothetical protein H110_03272 [Trichophy